MGQERQLHELLETDKKNPSLTIYPDKSDGSLHVYFGATLYERIKRKLISLLTAVRKLNMLVF